jgi:enterochelin esterase-like enzyme
MTRSDFAVLHEIGVDEAGLTIREVWRSGELKDNHSVPVHADGHFYGFNGRFLTCVSEETGEDLWKSRPPGGHTITLLEDHLLISARGALVAVAADPGGYRETGRIPVFERADPYTPPSYSEGRVYLRDLEELVVLNVAAGPAGARVARDDDGWGQPAEGTRFAAFLAGLRQAAPDERPAAVEAWLERQRGFPVREGDWVHIVFQGDVPDLGLQGDLTGWMIDEAMHRVSATDFYYSSHRVPPATRIDYVLKVFDEAMPDPRNPDRVMVLGEEHSTVATEGWVPSADTAELPLRGRFEERTLRSGLFDEEIAMKVYLPPGYDEGDAAYPLAILGHGTAALESGVAGHVLSNRIGESVEPLVAVFLEMPTMRWAVWYQQRTGNRIVEFLDRELLPFLDEGYRLDAAPERRALVGQEETSDASFLVPLAIPHRIAAASAQSGFAELVEMQQQVTPGFGSPATRGVRLRLEWSRYDRSRRLQAYDSRRTSAWLAAQLAEHGPQHLVVETTRGGSWGHWRHGLGEALAWLFPLDPAP